MEDAVWISRAMVQMSRVVEDCSRTWRQKPENPFADDGEVEGRYSKLVEVDRSLCRDGTSVTRVKYDS